MTVTPAAARLLAAAGVTVMRGDICDSATLRHALTISAPHHVYHLAAETGTGRSLHMPAHYSEVNITGTANFIDAICSSGNAVRRGVLAGSRSVYGEGARVDPEGRPAPAVEREPYDMAMGDFRPKDASGRPLTPVKTCADCPVTPMSI